jgi:membrane-associated phospholipid phosphatase
MAGMQSPLLRLAVTFIALLITLTVPIVLRVPIPGDWALVEWALSLRNDALTQVVWLLTFITSATPALLICLIVSGAYATRHLTGFNRTPFKLNKQNLSGVLMIAWPLIAFLGALASNIALRIAIGRMRPSVDYIPHGLPEIQADFQRFSYPSGHAGAAMVAFVALAALAWPHPRLRWLAFIGSALVIIGTGFGRVYLGVHWPTDVIGGYLLAGAWLAMALHAANRVTFPKT